MTRSKSAKTAARGDRRQEILAAAAQVITDRGLAETRIQDIAESCGVSTGLILYYFESKDRLLVEALTYANDQFYLRLSRELRKNPSARAQLDRLIELSVPGLLPDYPFLDEWALWVEIWVRALRDPEMAKEHEVLNRRWRRSIADIVRHGRETREFPDGLDPDELGVQIGALIDGLAIQVLMDHSDVTPEDMLRASREVSSKLIGFALEQASA
jgi:AcrR family transcriptional regulator